MSINIIAAAEYFCSLLLGMINLLTFQGLIISLALKIRLRLSPKRGNITWWGDEIYPSWAIIRCCPGASAQSRGELSESGLPLR